MERELIFVLGVFVLVLTMTGGMWMFLETSPSGVRAAHEDKDESENEKVHTAPEVAAIIV